MSGNSYEGLFHDGIPSAWINQPIIAAEDIIANTQSEEFAGTTRRATGLDKPTVAGLVFIGGVLVLIVVLLIKCFGKIAAESESEAESAARESLGHRQDVIDRVVADAKDAINAVSDESLSQLDQVASEVKGSETNDND